MRVERIHLTCIAIVLGSAITAGCSSSTESRPPTLVGAWQSDRMPLLPRGSYQTTLTLDAHGRVTSELRNYGAYPGQAPDDVSSYTRTIGSYELLPDSLRIRPGRIASWDRFEGEDAPEHVLETPPSPPPGGFPASHFTVNEDRLVLAYLSYPADGPVETTQTYHRMR